MQIKIGHVPYTISLINGYVDVDGLRSIGACDTDRCVIEVSDVPPAAKRLSILWHEIAHAWAAELGDGAPCPRDAEAFANLIGVAMSSMSVGEIARAIILVTRGIEASDVWVLPGLTEPIPLVSLACAFAEDRLPASPPATN